MWRSLGRRVAPGLFLIAAFGLVLSAIFPTDRGVVTVSTTGMIQANQPGNFAAIGIPMYLLMIVLPTVAAIVLLRAALAPRH